MYGKLKITGTIQVVTGLHIGGSTEFAAIGAVNSPVIRDPLTHLPDAEDDEVARSARPRYQWRLYRQCSHSLGDLLLLDYLIHNRHKVSYSSSCG